MQSQNLLNRLNGLNLEDIQFEYAMPKIDAMCKETMVSPSPIPRVIPIRLPCRLASPLIGVPTSIAEYCELGDESILRRLNNLNRDQLSWLRPLISEYLDKSSISVRYWTTSIDTFLRSMRHIHQSIESASGSEIECNNQLVKELVDYCVRHDLAQASRRTLEDVDKVLFSTNVSPILQFWTSYRARITQAIGKMRLGDQTLELLEFSAMILLKSNGQIVTMIGKDQNRVILIQSDRWVSVIDALSKSVTIVPSTYLDYAVTREEIFFNFTILSDQNEYKKFRDLFIYINELSEWNGNHNDIVTFMKSYEGFLNMTADFFADPRCSLYSYIDCIKSMIECDKVITMTDISVEEVIGLLGETSDEVYQQIGRKKHDSIMVKLCRAIRKMSPQELLEASSLHKFSFYAIIDEDKGIRKFCSRTFTARDVEDQAIMRLRCIFNREYIVSYFNKHKRLPKLLLDEKLLNSSHHLNVNYKYDSNTILKKRQQLLYMVKRKDIQVLKDQELIWWFDLRPYDCEENVLTGDPVEQAKDKRSCKSEGKYSLNDSEKELEVIMKSEEIEYIDIREMIRDEPVSQSIESITPGDRAYSTKLSCMLKEKEREQKIEGRLFGMNTTESKQTISMFMRKTEHVLSYFSGNLMTPSDKDRKLKIHNMAQSLLSDDHYSLLADIEGHNQSMQYKNSGDIAESIGLIYGEFNWYKLTKLFSNLNVFYAKAFDNETLIMKGQLGGIEGWYNPLWTLHTLLVCKLLPIMESIDLISEAVYSDDIAMVIKLPKFDNAIIDQLLLTVQRHFKKFGMLLKALQTVISKYRTTMLRQHYIAGVRADATLKRLVSTTAMGNAIFHSDELEVQGVVSAVTSALELSNRVLTPTILKWNRAIPLILRSFLSGMLTKIDIDLLNEDCISTGTRSFYHSLFDYYGSNEQPLLYEDILQLVKSKGVSIIIESLIGHRSAISLTPLSADILHTAASTLRRKMIDDDGLKVIFYVRSLMQQINGGYGVLSLEQQCLTGYNDSTSRSISIILSSFKDDYPASRIARKMIEYALGGKGTKAARSVKPIKSVVEFEDPEKDYHNQVFRINHKESDLVTMEWPNAQRMPSATDIIAGRLKLLFLSKCKNKTLKSLLESDKNRMDFKESIIDQLRGAYTYRVAAFYYNTSSFAIIDKILGKVETTSSMIRSVKNFDRMVESIANITVVAGRMALCKPLFTFGSIDMNSNIQEYLFQRRKLMYPDIIFLRMIEPEVNQMIDDDDDGGDDSSSSSNNGGSDDGNHSSGSSSSSDGDGTGVDDSWWDKLNRKYMRDDSWLCHLVFAPGGVYKDGRMEYLPPLYGNEALYKGELRDQEGCYSHIREVYLVKCISVSKWIIYRSDPKLYQENMDKQTNISNLADLVLTSLGYGKFSEYAQYVPLLARSEIQHRIPIMDFKSKAVCRSLPALTTRFKVVFNTKWVDYMGLKDSNIHFDYFKMRLIMAESVSSSVGLVPRFNVRYSMRLSELVADVRFNYLYPKNIDKDLSRYTLKYKYSGITTPSRIRWLTMNAVMNEGDPTSTIIPKEEGDFGSIRMIEDLFAITVIDWMKQIRREALWDYHPLWNYMPWEQFIEDNAEEIAKRGQDPVLVISGIIHRYLKGELTRITGLFKSEDKHVLFDYYVSMFCELDDYTQENDTNELAIIEGIMNDAYRTEDNMLKRVTQASLALKKVSGIGKQVLKRMIARNVITYCCVPIYTRTGLSIAQAQSYMSANFYPDHVFSVLVEQEVIYMSLAVVLKTLRPTDIELMIKDIIDDFIEFVHDNPFVEAIQDMATIKVEPTAHIFNEEISWERYDPLPVAYSVIESKNENEVKAMIKLVNYTKECIQRYGDPRVSESPLYSDTMITQLSLLTSLQNAKVLKFTDFIFDLASGRGEGHIVMSKLNIEHSSYCKPDVYNTVLRARGLTEIADYDLSSSELPHEIQVSLLDFGKEHNVVYLDISYIKGSKQGIFDRLLDLVALTNLMILRAALFTSEDTNILMQLLSRFKICNLALIGRSAQYSPYMYYIFSNDEDRMQGLLARDDMRSMIMKSVKITVAMKKTYSSRCKLYDSSHNSSMSSIRRIKEGYPLDTKFLDDTISLNTCNVRNQLLKMINNCNYIPIYLGFAKHNKDMYAKSLIIEQKDVKFVDSVIFDRSYIKNEDLELIKKKGGYTSVVRLLNTTDLTEHDCRVIRQYHPLLYYRRLANCIYILISELFPDHRDRMCDIIKDKLIEKKEDETRIAKVNRDLTDAYLLMILDACLNDPSYHIKILEPARLAGVIKERDMTRILYHRKHINCEYRRLIPIVGRISWKESNYAKLESTIANKWVKPLLKKGRSVIRKRLKVDHNTVLKKMEDNVRLINDEELEEMVNSMFNIEEFSSKLIESIKVERERDIEGITIPKIEVNDDQGIFEDIECMMSKLTLPDHVYDREDEAIEELKIEMPRREGESEEAYQARLQLAAMYSTMNDEWSCEEFDEEDY